MAGARRYFRDRPFISTVVLLVVLVVIGASVWFLFGDLEDTKNALVSSVLIGSVATGLTGILLGMLLNAFSRRGEDPIKLSTDYDALTKRYEEGCDAYAGDFCLRFSLFQYDNLSSSDLAKRLVRSESCCSVNRGPCKMPIDVLAFNGGGLSLSISDFPERRYQLPGYVERHFERIFACHGASKVTNNPMFRVESADCSGGEVRLVTSRTSYYDSLVTNRAADYRFCEGPTVRNMFEHGGCFLSLSDSDLSNHLGFNVNVITLDNVVVLALRRKDTSVAKGLYCPAVGSPVKLRYALEGFSGKLTAEGVERAVCRSIQDELALEEKEVEAIKTSGGLVLTAFYRDLAEAGKPQLLYNLFLPIEFDVLSNRMRNRASTCPNGVHGAASGVVRGVRMKDLQVACASPDGIAVKVVGGGVEFLAMTPSYVFSTMTLLLKEIEVSDW